MTSFICKCQIYKWFPHIFCAIAYRFRDILVYFLFLNFKSRSWSRSKIFVMTLFDGKCQNVQMILTHFCASSYHFRDMKMLNIIPSKSRSRSRSTIFAMTPFDRKFQSLKTSFFTYSIFAKVWPVHTIVTFSQTQKRTSSYSCRRILQICLKISAGTHSSKFEEFVDVWGCVGLW